MGILDGETTLHRFAKVIAYYVWMGLSSSHSACLTYAGSVALTVIYLLIEQYTIVCYRGMSDSFIGVCPMTEGARSCVPSPGTLPGHGMTLFTESNRFNFYLGISGESADLDARPSGTGCSEIFLINGIQVRKAFHVGQKNSYFDNSIKA